MQKAMAYRAVTCMLKLSVAQFLEKHSTEHIIKQLNKVYSNHPSKINVTISSLQFSSIEKEDGNQAWINLVG